MFFNIEMLLTALGYGRSSFYNIDYRAVARVDWMCVLEIRRSSVFILQTTQLRILRSSDSYASTPDDADLRPQALALICFQFFYYTEMYEI